MVDPSIRLRLWRLSSSAQVNMIQGLVGGGATFSPLRPFVNDLRGGDVVPRGRPRAPEQVLWSRCSKDKGESDDAADRDGRNHQHQTDDAPSKGSDQTSGLFI